jgi:hypothetical protein
MRGNNKGGEICYIRKEKKMILIKKTTMFKQKSQKFPLTISPHVLETSENRPPILVKKI